MSVLTEWRVRRFRRQMTTLDQPWVFPPLHTEAVRFRWWDRWKLRRRLVRVTQDPALPLVLGAVAVGALAVFLTGYLIGSAVRDFREADE